MTMNVGDRVRHSRCPEWGLGEVVASRGDKLHVTFENAGSKILVNAALEIVRGPAAESEVLDEIRSRSTTAGFHLVSRRGRYLNHPAKCTSCGERHEVVTRYSQSTIGPVVLCEDCKPGVLLRSFGRADLLDRISWWQDSGRGQFRIYSPEHLGGYCPKCGLGASKRERRCRACGAEI